MSNVPETYAFEPMETRTLLAHVGPDLNFGDNGLAPAEAWVLLAAVDGERILTVGSAGAMRLNGDGSADPSFVDEGAAQAALAKMNWAVGDALISGERLYLSGVLRPRKPDPSINSDVVFIRALNLADGSNVDSFGDGGFLTVQISSILPGPTVTVVTRPSMALAADGGIVFAVGQGTIDGNYRSKGVALYRADAQGRLSHTFGGNGTVPVAVHPGANDHGVGIDADGRILAFHNDSRRWSSGRLSAFHADGSVDDSFGEAGVARVPSSGFNSYTTLRMQPDGKMIVPLSNNGDGGTFSSIMRLNADGSREAIVGLGEESGGFYPPAIDSDGRIVIAANGKLVRLTPDFALDPAFDDDGSADIPPGFATGVVAFDAAGGILVGNANGVARYIESPPVMSVPVTLDADGVIRVDGDGGADTVHVAIDGRFLNVTINGEVFTFRADRVSGLAIDASDGDNTIDVATAELTIPVSIVTSFGDDDIRLSGKAPTSVTSGEGSDGIVTGEGDDVIVAGGNATVITHVGNDRVTLSDGFAEVDSGDGDDVIETNKALALVWAGEGNDVIRGSNYNRNDTFHGEGGDDTIVGGSGDDVITGGPGDDALFGVGGNNTIDGITSLNPNEPFTLGWLVEGSLLAFVGEPGDDQVAIWLDAATGRLTLWTDRGETSRSSSTITAIALYGAGGNDLLKLHKDLKFPATLDGGAGNDSLYGGAMPDILLGGEGTDYLFGRAGGDKLYGAGGNDELHGDAGDDYLEGGASNDVLLGDAGADTLLGLAGNDRFFAADGTRDQLSGGVGTDSAAADADDVLANIEIT